MNTLVCDDQDVINQSSDLARLQQLYRASSGTTQRARITALIAARFVENSRRQRAVMGKITFAPAPMASKAIKL